MNNRMPDALMAECTAHLQPSDTKFQDFVDAFVNEVKGKLIDEGCSSEDGSDYDEIEDPPVWKALICDS